MESSRDSIFYMSPGLRMALFMSLTGISMILGAFISFSLVAYLLHVPFSAIQTVILAPENSAIAQFANALASVITFGLPSLAVAFFTRGKLLNNMGFVSIKSLEQLSLVVVLSFAGLLLSGALGDLTEKIPMSHPFEIWANGLEDQYKKALVAMTQMKSIADLLFAIVAVAIVPAIIEELFFRSSLQKILTDWSGKPFVAIVVTAIIFSAFHFSYFGFLSRMSLGIVLGCVYYFTKSIWMPILMHFINNAIGVITLYVVRTDPQKVAAVIDGNLTYYWVFIAVLMVYFLLKKLYKISDHARLEKNL